MLIDSHCHLDRLKLDQYDGDLDRAVQAARDAGVERMLCIGIDLDNADAVVDIASRYEDVFASVGVHPLEKDKPEPSLEKLIQLASHKRVVAIGETGLDYYYSSDNIPTQQQRFITHLEAAKQCSLPVIIHTRDAREDTLALIDEHADKERAGVLHCFTESWDMAKAAMDMNFYISISGIVTFRNADALRDVVRKMPLDHLLLETDAPYLAPVPHRGKSNEPKYLPDVVKCVASLKGVSQETLAQQTADNFFKLFPLAS
ncbi:hydrolase TatD [Endozoicomonas montiporae]|uniref:Hydrolase TatD n=2 Tax=Endozoicomonas montiporae TaxID=1027273 RepID=A0A081NA39_9GAMM|nr:TatD family hydrolase [Endozoicomonas montiporae]AMO57007.1 preprotein translocase subunit TatD [Endozoicomonas montiporae CL-33]KEQ15312.1 hydrolase TatD [Endozoicomonas montiporae]